MLLEARAQEAGVTLAVEGDAGLEIDWAIRQAGNLDEATIMQKLQHLNINTLGIVWNRTPANYESYSDVDAAMAIINPDGSASLYKPAS